MKSALFTNFSIEPFVGYWNGKPIGVSHVIDPLDGKKRKGFASNQSMLMPDYLAKHLAKHLANRELLRRNANGDLIHKDGERMTSPKKPNEAPLFMDLFNKAYTPEEAETEAIEERDELAMQIDLLNKKKAEETKMGQREDNIASFPEDDDDEFEGKPVEGTQPAGQNEVRTNENA